MGILKKRRMTMDTPEACYSSPASRFVARFMGGRASKSASFDNSAANTDKTVVTDIGNVPGTPLQGASGNVDLLVRLTI